MKNDDDFIDASFLNDDFIDASSLNNDVIDASVSKKSQDFDCDNNINDDILPDIDLLDDSVSKKDEPFKKIISKTKKKKQTNIDVDTKSLDDYKPSIKDLNIKNKKTKKVISKVLLFTIIGLLISFEFLIVKTGNIFKNLTVYATNERPVRTFEQNRYGFITVNGDKIINPKYLYAEEFISNYSIVKNSNNLPLIIDRSGKEVVKIGKYFSLYRTANYIIASKITDEGWKYGLIDFNLKTSVKFKYDMINNVSDIFTFTKGNTVGVLNNEGKEIYTYKLTDKDDKKIIVNVSENNENENKYSVVTVNKSSCIINANTGKVVLKNTLNTFEVKNNNIFIEIDIDTKENKHIYIYNDEVVFESIDFTDVSIPDIKTGILKQITNNQKYVYYDTYNKKEVLKTSTLSDGFYGNGIFVYKDYNFSKNKVTYVAVSEGKTLFSINELSLIETGFINNYAIVKVGEDAFNFIDKNGKVLSKEKYIEVYNFSIGGFAKVKTVEGYGIIDNKGKKIIDCKYDDILVPNDNVSANMYKDMKQIIFAAKTPEGYKLITSKGKAFDNNKYESIEYDQEYSLIKVLQKNTYKLLLLEDKKEIIIFSEKYQAYNNYIKVSNEIYNYYGKLIYNIKEVDTNDNK